MYKLVVVDDEYNIRDGIVNAVPWKDCNVVVVGEACDGDEGLEVVEKTLPDIIITDINMDNMDGLAFAKHVKERYPWMKVIILSGYDEFEYAKTALQLKVFSYLLKPILPNELIEVVQEVIKEICEDSQIHEKIKSLESEVELNKEIIMEKLLKDLVYGKMRDIVHFQERTSLIDMNIKEGYFACLVFSLDSYYCLVEATSSSAVSTLLGEMRTIIQEEFSTEHVVWSFDDAAGSIVVILQENLGRRSLGIKKVYTSIDKVKEVVKTSLNVSVSVGIGNFYNDMLKLSHSYSEAAKALEFKITAGKGCIIHIDDVALMSPKPFTYPKDKEHAIILGLTHDDEQEIREALGSFFQEIELRACMKDDLRLSVMELFTVLSRKVLDLGLDMHRLYEKDLVDPYKALDRFDTTEEIKNWFTNIILGCIMALRKNRRDDTKSIIRKAQSYLECNYSNDGLSLDVLAEYLYLSPAYFSKLFKKETGKTYMEYLTRLRIQKAKELLKKTNIRINDIGSAVGYSNSQYFITLFKKLTGKTPSDYRERE